MLSGMQEQWRGQALRDVKDEQMKLRPEHNGQGK